MRKKAVKSILIILSILCLDELFGVYRRSALSEENFFSSLFQRGSLNIIGAWILTAAFLILLFSFLELRFQRKIARLILHKKR